MRCVLALIILPATAATDCPPGFAKCEWIGQTCGDNSCCTGMQTICGMNSICDGEGSKCGDRSLCTGMDTVCGPGSQCTGLGAQCGATIAAPVATVTVVPPMQPIQPMEPMQPMQPMKPMEPMQPMQPMKPMEPMQPMKPMEPMEPMKPMEPMQPMQPMKPMEPMKPMHFAPFKPVQPPAKVANNGCNIGAECQGRAASNMNGVEVCCPADCPNSCSMSSSQVNDVMTATCVCSADRPLFLSSEAPTSTAVHNEGCDADSACESRGGSMVDGKRFCCPGECAVGCGISVSQSGDGVHASCTCPMKAWTPHWTSTEACVAFAGVAALVGAGAYILHKRQAPELSEKLLQ